MLLVLSKFQLERAQNAKRQSYLRFDFPRALPNCSSKRQDVPFFRTFAGAEIRGSSGDWKLERYQPRMRRHIHFLRRGSFV
jgi:hypothetical protein